jgi:hypothetical protein
MIKVDKKTIVYYSIYNVPVLQIRITLRRIWILLLTLMPIRIRIL